MSVLKFELKEEHFKLLKNLKWGMNKDKIIIGVSKDETDEFAPPFGEDNLYYAIDLILNGKPTNFDPLNDEGEINYSQEQINEWDKLYSELPMALSIILQRQSFETGTYKAKYHNQVWKKIK
jgi:hypothetical protein